VWSIWMSSPGSTVYPVSSRTSRRAAAASDSPTSSAPAGKYQTRPAVCPAPPRSARNGRRSRPRPPPTR
jgi:hypothetical protein